MEAVKEHIYYKVVDLEHGKLVVLTKKGAAGTLKWKKNGFIQGHGSDYNNNKVKFTVSQKS